MEGNRDVALAALMANPLIGDGEKAIPLLDDILEANKSFVEGILS
jgi:alpha-galactosidase/6-phospho-beta-glucosidase family protein